jgi:hypothetical protein
MTEGSNGMDQGIGSVTNATTTVSKRRAKKKVHQVDVLVQESTSITVTKKSSLKRKFEIEAEKNDSRTTTIKRRRRIHFPQKGEETTTEKKGEKNQIRGSDIDGGKKSTKRSKPSTSSSSNGKIEIGRPLNESDIKVGMVVWSHIQGYPWWPSKVTRLEGHRVFVYFYGPDETDKWGWVSKKDCRRFDAESAKQVYERPVKSALIRSLKSATQEALVEYLNHAAEVENNDLCYICKTGGFLILCDGCMNACHCECDDPPMDSIPEGVWYCPECRKRGIQNKVQRTKRRTNGSKSSEEPSTPTTPTTSAVQSILKNYKPYVARDDPVTRIIERAYWKDLQGTKEDYESYRRHLITVQKEKKMSTLRKKKGTEESSDWDRSGSVNIEATASRRKRERYTVANDLEIINGANMPEHYLSAESEPETTEESEDKSEKKTVATAVHERKKKRIRRHNNNVAPTTDVGDRTQDTTTDDDRTSDREQVVITERKSEAPRRRRRKIMTHTVTPPAAEADLSEDGNMCKIFIRYRYNNETDDQMKLIKREVKYDKGLVTRSLIESILFQDCIVDEELISEVRYYDNDERGWLSMKDKLNFNVETHRSGGDEGNEQSGEETKRLRMTLIVYVNSRPKSNNNV